MNYYKLQDRIHMNRFAAAYSGIVSTKEDRKKNDYYPTPPVATWSLIEQEAAWGGIPESIWEPAAGRGWMAREFRRCEYDVLATDLFEYQNLLTPVCPNVDFLTIQPFANMAVITNPPYKNGLANVFMKKIIDCGKDGIIPYGALLVRLTFQESEKRRLLFKEYPPTRVHTFSTRFNCDDDLLEQGKQLGGVVAYAWYVWDFRVPKQLPVMDWIDTKAMLVSWEESNKIFPYIPK
jgi:hypothetical protein